jgi:hypothetical protein
MHPIEVVPILAVFGTVAFVAYLWLSARHKERMALIEHNQNAEIFTPGPKRQGSWALKIGLLLSFAGAGLLLGYLFARLTGLPEELGVFSFLFMLGGAGLITYYNISRRHEPVDEHEQVV